eukprot:10782605-Lingulodinium_polyedra.AAC.1
MVHGARRIHSARCIVRSVQYAVSTMIHSAYYTGRGTSYAVTKYTMQSIWCRGHIACYSAHGQRVCYAAWGSHA